MAGCRGAWTQPPQGPTEGAAVNAQGDPLPGDPLPGMTWCMTCGGDVERKAERCPHCGRERPTSMMTRPFKAGMWVVIALLALLLIRLVFVVMVISTAHRT